MALEFLQFLSSYEGTRLFTYKYDWQSFESRKISTGKLMMWKGWSKIKNNILLHDTYITSRE